MDYASAVALSSDGNDDWYHYIFPSILIVLASFWFVFGLTYFLTFYEDKEPLECPALKNRFKGADFLLNFPFYVVFCALCIQACSELRGDLESRWFGKTSSSCWATTLYVVRMCWDTFCMQWSHAGDKSRSEMTAHHVSGLVAIGASAVTGYCHFYACLDLCCEVTTVFLGNIFALKTFTCEGPIANVLIAINGVCLWLGFIVFRLVLFPVWFYMFFADVANDPEHTWHVIGTVLGSFWVAVNILLLALSTMWFVPITKGLLKAICGEGEEANQDDKNQSLLPAGETSADAA